MAIRGLGSLSKDELDLSWFDASMAYDITPDGSTVLSVELGYGEGRNSAIYLRKTDGSPSVKIGYGNRPALSADGKWVVCIFRQDQNSIIKILPTGAGEDKLLSTDGMKYDFAEWFPGQERLLVTASASGSKPICGRIGGPLSDSQLHPIDSRVASGLLEGFARWPLDRSPSLKASSGCFPSSPQDSPVT